MLMRISQRLSYLRADVFKVSLWAYPIHPPPTRLSSLFSRLRSLRVPSHFYPGLITRSTTTATRPAGGGGTPPSGVCFSLSRMRTFPSPQPTSELSLSSSPNSPPPPTPNPLPVSGLLSTRHLIAAPASRGFEGPFFLRSAIIRLLLGRFFPVSLG